MLSARASVQFLSRLRRDPRCLRPFVTHHQPVRWYPPYLGAVISSELPSQSRIRRFHETVPGRARHDTSGKGPSSGPSEGFIKLFVDSVRRQVKENQEFQKNVKQLQDETDKMRESDTLKRAKDVTEGVKDVGGKVAKGVQAVGDTRVGKGVVKAVQKTGKVTGQALNTAVDATAKAATPILNDPRVKAVHRIIEEGSLKYGGILPKTVREDIKKARLEKYESVQKDTVQANENAGTNIVTHKESRFRQYWSAFKEQSRLGERVFHMKRRYDETENPVVAGIRDVVDQVHYNLTSFFEETETAEALKHMKLKDRNFSLDMFLKEARLYIVPEIIEAYLRGEREELRMWTNEATYSVLTAGWDEQLKQGLVSDSRVIDIRGLDFVTAKLVNDEVPVIVVSLQAQEIILFRNRVSGGIVFGKEDHIDNAAYVMAFTIETENEYPVTGGWRVVEMVKTQARMF